MNGTDKSCGPHGAAILVDSAPRPATPEKRLSAPPIQRPKVTSAKWYIGRPRHQILAEGRQEYKALPGVKTGDSGYWSDGQS